MVYRFISEETVEEKIRKLQMHKQKLANELIETSNLFKHLSEKKKCGFVLELYLICTGIIMVNSDTKEIRISDF